MRSTKYLIAAALTTFLLLLTIVYRSRPASGASSFQIWESSRRKQDTTQQEEKYITFYPHSGLHNQRLALLNAMVLAKALDRTLILPEINIGRGVYWWPSPQLEQKMSDCPSRPVLDRKGLCTEYRHYVPVPVSTIFDLSVLDNVGIKYIQRDDMSTSYFASEWGVEHDDPEHVYRLNDDSRFSYRIFDVKESSTQELMQFKYRIDLDDLAARSERFMVFGSLFATPRLVLERDDLYWLREYLASEMGFGHPTVIQQTLNVVSLLGGPGEFASVHLRTGDGVFKATMTYTMDKVREQLAQVNAGTHRMHHQHEYELIDRLQSLAQEGKYDTMLNECVALQHDRDLLHPRLRLIFMATDTAQPRHTVPHLFEEFVCMFTLSDFSQAIDIAMTSSDSYGPLLLPLIDAEIAAHGSFFVGTRKSTFSKYIQYRNRRFLAYYPQVNAA